MLTVIGAAYIYLCADNQIRQIVEQHLDDHYAMHHVSIRSARRISARQIALRGLEISVRDAPPNSAPILSVDEVLIRCNTGVDDLVQLRFSLDRVTLRGICLRLEHRADNSLNLQDLFPLPRLGNDSLITVIDGGRVTYIDRRRPAARPVELSDVSLQVEFPASANSEQQAAAPFKFHGSARGMESQRLKFVGQYDKSTQAWSAQGWLKGLLVASELERSVPTAWMETMQQFGSFRTQADLRFELFSPPATSPTADTRDWFANRVQFQIDGNLSEGHLDVDSRLPFPLTEVTSQIHCDNGSVSMSGLEARCGRTRVKASFSCNGYDLHHPFTLAATASNVHLVEYTSVLESLPPTIQKHWEQFSPAGEVSFQLNLASDGQTIRPDLSVTCHNLSFTTPKINYRLHRGHGTIALRDNILDVDLAAQASGQEVHLGGRIHQPGPDGWGRMELQSIDAIPINRTLSDSLNPSASQILAAFDPQGSFMVRHARFERSDPAEPWHHDLLISLERCYMQHEMFPYPLSNVHGMLRMQDKEWTFYDLQGQNDSGHVVGHGRWELTPEGGLLRLEFAASHIALEDELRDALSAKARAIWANLRPRGSLDRIVVNISKRQGEACSLHVVLDKGPAEQSIQGRTIAVHPTWFPYQMDDVTGQLVYDDGQMKFRQLRARHGEVELVTSGGCQWDRMGAWQLRLEDLSVDRLVLDRDLAAALPNKLRQAAIQLDPQGPINLAGSIAFAAEPNARLASSWNVKLSTAGGAIRPGVPLEHVFGGIHLVGSYDGERIQSQGQLDFDSMMYRGVQVTDIQGPIWIDNSRIYLGSWSSQTRQQQLPPHLEARVFGGTIYADGRVPFDPRERFEINASLADGDLARASLVAGAQQPISGKAFGFVKLTGAGTGWHSLNGSGAINLRDADIYQLNFMVALLKLIKIRTPDRTAFTESDIRFRVSGNHIYFDPIKFKGDAVSLVGSGDMEIAGDLNIDFYAMVGREQLKLPLVRPVLGEASRQFMLIHVGGPLDDPQLKRQPFPGLNETIQQIFPEASRRQEERSSRLPRLRRKRVTR